MRIERAPAHDGEKLASVLSALVPHRAAGVCGSAGQVGYAAPGEGDEVLKAAPAAAALSAPRPAVPPGLALGRADGGTADDPLAEVVDAIDGDEWQALAAPIIEPVLARAKADPEGLLDDIAAAYPEMDAEALTERLARILFVAEVYGRADA